MMALLQVISYNFNRMMKSSDFNNSNINSFPSGISVVDSVTHNHGGHIMVTFLFKLGYMVPQYY